MWNVSPCLSGCLLLLLLLAGCPDEGQSATDSGVEGGCPDVVPWPVDTRLDAPVAASKDRGPDQPPGPDLVGPGCVLPVQKTLALSGGVASTTGEIPRTPTNNLVTLPATSCATARGAGSGCADLGTPGPDLGTGAAPWSKGSDHFYRVTLSGGTAYDVYLHPEGGHDTVGYNALVYVFADCSCPWASCLGKKDEGQSGQGEVVSFTPATSGTYYIGVDSLYKASHPGSYGKYTLTVMERNKPGNDTCAAARPLALATGSTSIRVHGHSGEASDTASLDASGCTGHATAGPDVFYSLAMTRGKTYTIGLDGVGFDESLYLFTSCGDVAGTCGEGMGADRLVFGPEKLVFSPDKDGTYIIGVDGKGKKDSGAFALKIDVHATPPNDACATRETLSWKEAKATATGDSSKATDRLSFVADTGCAGTRATGPELFYAVTLGAGKTYRIKVTPGAGYDPAIYLFGSCAAVDTSCLGSADAMPAGGTEELRITPKAQGTYVLAVDSGNGASGDAAGTFAVEIVELSPPKNSACAGAVPLSWCGKKVAVHGDTTRAAAAVDLPATGCTGGDTEGGDLFYTVSLTANKRYAVTVQPSAGYNAALYVLAGCDKGACVAGADSGSAGAAETVTFEAKKDGAHIIGVDSRYATGAGLGAGTFVLTVEEK